jgi:D-Tyr-tRNAtyr deacylase
MVDFDLEASRIEQGVECRHAAMIQRNPEVSVTVEGRVIGEIGLGLVLFVCVGGSALLISQFTLAADGFRVEPAPARSGAG